MIYNIRTLTSASDLTQSFKLRHDTYVELGYAAPSQVRLEIDEYDERSVQLGAFSETQELVGTLRIITTKRRSTCDRIQKIVSDSNDQQLLAATSRPRMWPLPSISSLQIQQQIDKLNARDWPVLELSRFIVRPEHRSSRISRGLVVLGIALGALHTPAIFVGGCLPKHVRMYAEYGFSRLPGTGIDYHNSVGQLASTIICRSDVLPASMRNDVDALSQSMATGNQEHACALGRDSRALYQLLNNGHCSRHTQEKT